MAPKVDDVVGEHHHDEDQDLQKVDLGSAPGDLMSLGTVDQALTAKMNLVNDVCSYSNQPLSYTLTCQRQLIKLALLLIIGSCSFSMASGTYSEELVLRPFIY